MNREIKFRVWDDEEKIYLYKKGFHDVAFRDNGLCFPYGTGRSTDKYPNRFTVEQFTGLKDKNGKEIYEGDIIKRRNFFVSGFERIEIEEYDISTVEWSSAGFWNFAINDTNKTSALFEVIGNIHENPELLK